MARGDAASGPGQQLLKRVGGARRLSITLTEKAYLELLAICRIEQRKPAELARALFEAGLRGARANHAKLVRPGHGLRLVTAADDGEVVPST